ncbi:ABC transporter permease [Hymenobacter taeanensis]|uniref:ABC transporter permease n=1 Tax=Hymenobacter taeanensis TaxID=2735321 RepID=A0A6M6BFS4_9BACT|nr:MULTISPECIES: ABC transporter permease [Hymenobacter]QJX45995.1 ABC transporter permease [Hymenobacter taeanensis]UOQ79847.1 ABC transporter permease [Hymenobacter sp. 5414T-23]
MKRKQWSTHVAAWGWLLLVGLAALAAPSVSPPPDLLNTLVPPFHMPNWLGTDTVGHDIWNSLLAGARSTLLISLPAALLSNLLGGCLGVAAGFFGNSRLRVATSWCIGSLAAVLALVAGIGLLWDSPSLLLLFTIGIGGAAGTLLHRTHWGRRPLPVPLDTFVQSLIALLDSIPLLVLVLTVAAIQQPSPLGLVVLLTVTCWTTPARLLRAATLRTASLPYVLAAEAAGIPPLQIVRKHIALNVWPVLRIRIPLSIALIIGLETTLAFLGVGLPPDVASWGRLLASSRLAPTAWWLIGWPSAALFLTIWALQTLGQPKNLAVATHNDVTK